MENPRGVNHIRAKDDIKAIRCESLRGDLLLDVEKLEPHERIARAEHPLAMPLERKRDIRINVFDSVFKFTDRFRDEPRSRPGTGTDLQDPDRSRGSMAQTCRDVFTDGRGGKAIKVIGEQGSSIDARDQFYRTVRKHHIGRRNITRNHSRQSLDATPK